MTTLAPHGVPNKSSSIARLNLKDMHTRARRDRHGRGTRGPLIPHAVPRFRSRKELFDAAVLEAYSDIHTRYSSQLAYLDIAVDTIPRMRLRSDIIDLPEEIAADGPVPLGRLISAGVDAQGNPTRSRLVIFRMPIEQRVNNTYERVELLKTILTYLVANYLNIRPEDIDPEFQW